MGWAAVLGLLECLADTAAHVEGLFGTGTAEPVHVRAFAAAFDQAGGQVQLKAAGDDPHLAAATLQHLLAQLPRPLLTHSDLADVKLSLHEKLPRTKADWLAACCRLPVERRAAAAALMHLCRLLLHLAAVNKCTPDGLAAALVAAVVHVQPRKQQHAHCAHSAAERMLAEIFLEIGLVAPPPDSAPAGMDATDFGVSDFGDSDATATNVGNRWVVSSDTREAAEDERVQQDQSQQDSESTEEEEIHADEFEDTRHLEAAATVAAAAGLLQQVTELQAQLAAATEAAAARQPAEARDSAVEQTDQTAAQVAAAAAAETAAAVAGGAEAEYIMWSSDDGDFMSEWSAADEPWAADTAHTVPTATAAPVAKPPLYERDSHLEASTGDRNAEFDDKPEGTCTVDLQQLLRLHSAPAGPATRHSLGGMAPCASRTRSNRRKSDPPGLASRRKPALHTGRFVKTPKMIARDAREEEGSSVLGRGRRRRQSLGKKSPGRGDGGGAGGEGGGRRKEVITARSAATRRAKGKPSRHNEKSGGGVGPVELGLLRSLERCSSSQPAAVDGGVGEATPRGTARSERHGLPPQPQQQWLEPGPDALVRHSPFVFVTAFALFQRVAHGDRPQCCGEEWRERFVQQLAQHRDMEGRTARGGPSAEVLRGGQGVEGRARGDSTQEHAQEGAARDDLSRSMSSKASATVGRPGQRRLDRRAANGVTTRALRRSSSSRGLDGFVADDTAAAAAVCSMPAAMLPEFDEPASNEAPPRLFEAVLAVGFSADQSSGLVAAAESLPCQDRWSTDGGADGEEQFAGDVLGRYPEQDFADGPFGKGLPAAHSTMFIHPSGAAFQTVAAGPPACSVHMFVMTNAEGQRVFGHVISAAYKLQPAECDFVEEMIMARETMVVAAGGAGLDAESTLLASRMRRARESNQPDRALWSRRSLCLLSLCPFHQTFLWCLVAMASQNAAAFKGPTAEFGRAATAMSRVVHSVFWPRLGSQKAVGGFAIEWLPQPRFGFATADHDFAALGRALSPEKILFVLLALISERQLLFVSSHVSKLCAVTEPLLALLQPFKWRAPLAYVPVLPDCARHLLETAFMPCIFGVTRGQLEGVHVDPSFICIDVDKGSAAGTVHPKGLSLPRQQAAKLRTAVEQFCTVARGDQFCPSYVPVQQPSSATSDEGDVKTVPSLTKSDEIGRLSFIMHDDDGGRSAAAAGEFASTDSGQYVDHVRYATRTPRPPDAQTRGHLKQRHSKHGTKPAVWRAASAAAGLAAHHFDATIEMPAAVLRLRSAFEEFFVSCIAPFRAHFQRDKDSAIGEYDGCRRAFLDLSKTTTAGSFSSVGSDNSSSSGNAVSQCTPDHFLVGSRLHVRARLTGHEPPDGGTFAVMFKAGHGAADTVFMVQFCTVNYPGENGAGSISVGSGGRNRFTRASTGGLHQRPTVGVSRKICRVGRSQRPEEVPFSEHIRRDEPFVRTHAQTHPFRG